jgi:SAM-dependent methyltransferase
VTWQKADAMQLPFDDASFDVVACQFGAMFFPDRALAYAEARRVLRPGGTLVFNVWDRIEENEFADVVTDALAVVFPADPPRFMARTPHGYSDRQTIATDVANGGFNAAAAHRDDRRPQPRGNRPCAGARLLPGYAAAQRDRGPGRCHARRSDSGVRSRHRPPVRHRPDRRQDPGARGLVDR